MDVLASLSLCFLSSAGEVWSVVQDLWRTHNLPDVQKLQKSADQLQHPRGRRSRSHRVAWIWVQRQEAETLLCSSEFLGNGRKGAFWGRSALILKFFILCLTSLQLADAKKLWFSLPLLSFVPFHNIFKAIFAPLSYTWLHPQPTNCLVRSHQSYVPAQEHIWGFLLHCRCVRVSVCILPVERRKGRKAKRCIVGKALVSEERVLYIFIFTDTDKELFRSCRILNLHTLQRDFMKLNTIWIKKLYRSRLSPVTFMSSHLPSNRSRTAMRT